MSDRQSFDNVPQSVTQARHFAREVLLGAPSQVLETAELLVSELASNCILHTDGGFDLEIVQSTEGIRIEATDRGGGEPVLRSPAPSDPSGRGLQIIDMLSADWGVNRRAGVGKTVWVRLSAPTRATVA